MYFGILVLTLWIAAGTGLALLTKSQQWFLEESDFSWLELGSSILLGLGTIGLIGLVIALMNIFTFPVLLALGFVLLITTSRPLWIKLKKLTGEKKSWNPFTILGLSICLAIFASLFLRALNPPWIADELGYHMPHVELIVKAHSIPLNFDGHYFFGNIPKLMEVIFAIGVVLKGFSLAHLLHLSFLAGFCFLVFGILQKRYSTKTGLLAILFIVTYDDLVTNAVIGYIDAATVILEISGLLLIIDWLSLRRNSLLVTAGCLIGFSVSMKYSSLPTLLFLLLVVVFVLTRDKALTWRQRIRTLFYFGTPPFLIAFYWYGKNLIQFHNPTYPLYFGHPGVDESHFQGLLDAIQWFSPRTLHQFLLVPTRVLALGSLPVFFSFYLAPLTIFIKRSRSFHLILIIYFCLYFPYWFFIATHQIRFLMPGLLTSLILTAIFLTNLSWKKSIVVFVSLGLITAGLNQGFHFLTFSSQVSEMIGNKFQITEISYPLGKITYSDYLNSRLGCQYSVMESLKKQDLKGAVIDNWTLWFDPSAAFYADHNRFISLDFDPHKTHEDIYQFLISKDIHFLYINTSTRAQHFSSQAPDVIAHRIGPAAAEDFLMPYTNLKQSFGPCKLYELDLEKLRQN